MRQSLTSAGTPQGAGKWRESRRLMTRGFATGACGAHRPSGAGAAAARAGRPGAEAAEGEPTPSSNPKRLEKDVTRRLRPCPLRSWCGVSHSVDCRGSMRSHTRVPPLRQPRQRGPPREDRPFGPSRSRRA